MSPSSTLICFGKNYLDHAKELGDAVPDKPVIFLKPWSVLREVRAWGEQLTLTLPQNRGLVHYECELVLKLKAGGSDLSLSEAEAAIGWVSVGLDMTLRDVQADLKKKGHPWTTGKAFVDSAVVGPWLAVQDCPDYARQRFQLHINHALRQQATAEEMTFSPAELLRYASEFFPLAAGDVIYTGTPVGVGPVNVGDTAELSFAGRSYGVCWQ